MALPIWDPIEIPPDYTLVDINGIADEDLRLSLQAQALEVWMDETGGEWQPRLWDPNEGAFAIYDGEELLGITVIWEVEDAV